MCKFSLTKFLTRFAIFALVTFTSTAAMAQLSTFSELFEKYVQVDAAKEQDGPKLHAQFNFSADNKLLTRSELKLDNDGFEDHTVLGLAQHIGVVRTKVAYNLRRFSYSSWEEQSEDLTVDVIYRSLHLRHLQEATSQSTSIGLPLNVSTAHFDFLYSQIHQNDSIDSIGAYQFVTKLDRLKLSATWKDVGAGVWSDFTTEYRPMTSWLMQVSYTNDGIDMRRRFRSVYTGKSFRLAGEYTAMTDLQDQTHITSAIDIKKETKLAALSLRLKYDGYIDSSTLLFKVETHEVF